jgi:hypothetical protein
VFELALVFSFVESTRRGFLRKKVTILATALEFFSEEVLELSGGFVV